MLLESLLDLLYRYLVGITKVYLVNPSNPRSFACPIRGMLSRPKVSVQQQLHTVLEHRVPLPLTACSLSPMWETTQTDPRDEFRFESRQLQGEFRQIDFSPPLTAN